MITKDKTWNMIVSEMKTIHMIQNISKSVMSKIKELDKDAKKERK